MWKAQHITKTPNWNWWVRWEKNKRYTKIFDTQKEAINHGRGIAINQKSELVIHSKKWKIRDKDSFWNDPRNIKW